MAILNSSGMVCLISRPNGSNNCTLCGVANPMLYKFSRIDFSISSLSNNAGNIQFVISGVDVTANFSAGKTFTILHQSTDVGGRLKPVIVTITSSSFGGGNTTVQTSTSYTANYPAAPVIYPLAANDNSLLNFYIEVEIWTSRTYNPRLFTALRVSPPINTGYYDTGWINVDVSKVLQGFLSPEDYYDYANPVNYTNDLSGLADNVQSMQLPFFIKYQGVWTGGNSGQTSDNGGVENVTAVLGGFPVDRVSLLPADKTVGNSYQPYLNLGKNSLATLSSWTNVGAGTKPWSISGTPGVSFTSLQQFVFSQYLATPFVLLKGINYSFNVTITNSTPLNLLEIVSLDSSNNVVEQLYNIGSGGFSGTMNITPNFNGGIKIAVHCQSDDAGVTESVVVNTFSLLSVSNTNFNWITLFTRPKLWLNYSFTISALILNPTDVVLKMLVNFKNGTSTLITDLTTPPIPVTANTIFRVDPQKVYFLNTSGHTMAQDSVTSFSLQLSSPTGGNGNVISVDCIDTSIEQNIKLLAWRSSLGSMCYWGFDFNQEAQYFYQNGTKNKRFNLFAEGLTANEWECIQEMSTLGTVFKPTLIELTQSVNKVQTRIGQQVYLLDAAGNKTGTIVIPTESVTETKRRAHRLQLTVELPEQQLAI